MGKLNESVLNPRLTEPPTRNICMNGVVKLIVFGQK